MSYQLGAGHASCLAGTTLHGQLRMSYQLGAGHASCLTATTNHAQDRMFFPPLVIPMVVFLVTQVGNVSILLHLFVYHKVTHASL